MNQEEKGKRPRIQTCGRKIKSMLSAGDRAVVSLFFFGIIASFPVSGADHTITYEFTVGKTVEKEINPNEDAPDELSSTETTYISVSIGSADGWQIIEEETGFSSAQFTGNATSASYLHDPLDPSTAYTSYSGSFWGKVKKIPEGDGEEGGPIIKPYSVSVSGSEEGGLRVVPDSAAVAFTDGTSEDYTAKKNDNTVTADTWSISGGSATDINGSGTATLQSSDPDDAASYTVTAEKDGDSATAQFIPTAVGSVSGGGKSATMSSPTTEITVPVGETITFQASSTSGEFPSGQPTWNVSGSGTDYTIDGKECEVTFSQASADSSDYKIVKARCGDDDVWKTLEVLVCDVGLQSITSRSPSLEYKGRICLNAQDEYKKAKFEVTVKPEGTTAAVTQDDGASDADITLSKTTLQDGDTFLVEQNGETGKYVIEHEHNGCSDCTDTYSETVFEFELKETNTQYSPASTGQGGVSNDHKIEFGVNNTYGVKHAADVQTKTYAYFITNPSGVYSQYVKAKLRATQSFKSTSGGTAQYGAYVFRDNLAGADLSISLNFGLISVTVSDTNDVGAWAAWKGNIKLKGPDENKWRKSPVSQTNAQSENIPYISGGHDIIDISTTSGVTNFVNHYHVGDSSSRAEVRSKHSCSGAADTNKFNATGEANLGMAKGPIIMVDPKSDLKITSTSSP